MKILSKITLGVVSIFSLCSCGKGRETTREKFIEKVNEIDTNCPYRRAKLVYTKTTKRGTDKDPREDETTYTCVYQKNNSGEWEYSKSKNDEMDNIFRSILDTIRPYNAINRFDEMENKKEKYYIKPFGYEISGDTDYSSMYGYYKWDDYGFITYGEAKTEYKSTSKSKFNSEIEKIEVSWR